MFGEFRCTSCLCSSTSMQNDHQCRQNCYLLDLLEIANLHNGPSKHIWPHDPTLQIGANDNGCISIAKR
ncbi:hypothetical protein TcWFU_001989 [Taenia crassiceps]|uniref:Uncharacterized protein n=1 Tax=Taenia crassiceps TaxID=6207 RepID=A0ABR4QP64_9CEST